MPSSPTWIVLTRDVSGSVRVKGSPVVVTSLIMDADTGLIRAAISASTGSAARTQAIRQALDTPTGHAAAGPPARVICAPGDADAVTSDLVAILGRPVVASEAVSDEAEDIFDSLIGSLSGRHQPDSPPDAGDWAQLVAGSHEYRAAEPWLARGDDEPLDLVVRIAGVSARYVAVVLGQEGIQHGLVLYPGTSLPDSVLREQEAEARVPAGTLMYYLDPPREHPAEFAAKAARYGWPAGDDLSPAWVAGAPDGGPADLDQAQAHRLVVAIAAVLAHDDDSRAPVPGPTAGRVSLPGGISGRYRISETI